jgi:molybdopterin-containing oxidoreductase family iron-sulfur binding subunit
VSEGTTPCGGGSERSITRREALGGLVALAAAVMNGGCDRAQLEELVQSHFQELGDPELQALLARLEKKYAEKYGQPFEVSATPAQEGVEFGYALDISRCVGCRRCVHACVKENNQSRDPPIHWISVLEMDKKKGVDVFESNLYYNPETVPQPDKFYFPVACQQCRNPPCVKVCPVNATWKDKDGIVVIDYDWCIGCRCCMTACPYGARHFNWRDPVLPAKGAGEDSVNLDTEYLGNRPRPRGVVEKCTFCVQRTRKGLYPACVEVCPVGARKFGNLLDPASEIRYVLEHKRVFIFKEELGTEPRFYYYFGL